MPLKLPVIRCCIRFDEGGKAWVQIYMLSSCNVLETIALVVSPLHSNFHLNMLDANVLAIILWILFFTSETWSMFIRLKGFFLRKKMEMKISNQKASIRDKIQVVQAIMSWNRNNTFWLLVVRWQKGNFEMRYASKSTLLFMDGCVMKCNCLYSVIEFFFSNRK